MDKTARIQIFVEVAKQRSFAGAARRLGMTGAAVSKQIQNLESDLATKLLNRTTRHVSLTEEGVIYFRVADRVLADLTEVENQLHEMREIPTGRLKVNAPSSFGNQYLAKIIGSFAAQFPRVQLDVEFDDRWVDVVGEGFDVVIRIGVLEDSTLISRKLADCPIWLCVAPLCLEREGEVTSVDQLKSYPAVTYSKHGVSETWHCRQNNKETSVKLNRVLSANTAEMQLEACMAGVGVALLPAFAAHNHLRNGDLIRVLPEAETIPLRGVYALYPHNRQPAARVRMFIDWLVDKQLGRLWGD